MQWIFVWCILIFLTKENQGTLSQNACTSESRCRCRWSTHYPGKWKANCSGRNLTTSPFFASDVVEIDLSNNNLTTFPNGSKIPRGLITLDISRNSLHHFPKDSFSNLSRLEKLSIEQNSNDLSSTLLTAGVFKDLRNLRFLNLKQKGINNDSYPEDALSDLVSLETLLINGRENGFGPKFQRLRNLTYIDISGSKGNNCSVNFFHRGYFESVRNIRKLDVSMCKLQNLLLNTFSGLHQLEELDISNNEELSFSILRNVSRDLKLTKIKILRFNKIHCTFGLGTEIYISDIIDLQNTTLKELYADSNRLEMVQSGVSMYLPRSLERLSTADNRLTMGMYALESANLVNLRTYDQSKQYFSHNPKYIFSRCNDSRRRYERNLPTEMIQVHQNDSSTVIDDRVFTKLLGYDIEGLLNEDFSRLHNVKRRHNEYEFPFPIPSMVPLPQHLETAYFNLSTLRYPIPRYKIGNNKVKRVYAQDNVFYEWIGPIENMHKVEILDLSNNFCTNVSTYFFDFLTGLRHLKINDNILGFSLERDQNGETFKNLRKLRRLEMANNRIQALPSKMFINLVSLEVLILKNNLLRDFNVSLTQMQRLVFLDLSINRLQGLSEQTMHELNAIAQKNNVTVDLSGNILQCNCEDINFIRWLATSDIKFIFHNNDTCLTKFGKTGRMPLKEREEIVLRLQKGCKSYTTLIVTLSTVIVVIVTTIVCALIYRFRWKLRYLYYMTKGRYRGYTSIKQSREEEEDYDFDAFVSYAEEDRGFAFHIVKEKLESDGRLNLCFHSRDFVPGFDIAENITRAIHNSRKTICILSKNYLKSYWCMYELNIGRMESIYSREGEDVLFLILYDQVVSSNIPLSIMDLIDKKSYIEYPNDPQGDVVFWQKIREAIVI